MKEWPRYLPYNKDKQSNSIERGVVLVRLQKSLEFGFRERIEVECLYVVLGRRI
jgi:hypothetical protein